MKKLVGLTLCSMLVLLTFASNVFATTYTFDSFTAGDGYGTKTKVDDNITKLNGTWDETMGMKVGPFSKASKAKLADGIQEETYVEIDLEELKQGELFEVSLALKNNKDEYVSEAVVSSQKTNDGEVSVTAGWASNFKAVVKESGIYTYRWEVYTKNNKTYVEFTLLNGEDVVGTTGIIDFDTITTTDTKNPIAGQDDVSVKYLWFCNIQVENGINVYAELPKTEDPTDPTEQPTEPTEPTTPEESETTETPEETKTSSESKEKDNTPKTGSANVALMATVVSAISLAGIVTVKKYTK